MTVCTGDISRGAGPDRSLEMIVGKVRKIHFAVEIEYKVRHL